MATAPKSYPARAAEAVQGFAFLGMVTSNIGHNESLQLYPRVRLPMRCWPVESTMPSVPIRTLGGKLRKWKWPLSHLPSMRAACCHERRCSPMFSFYTELDACLRSYWSSGSFWTLVKRAFEVAADCFRSMRCARLLVRYLRIFAEAMSSMMLIDTCGRRTSSNM